MYLVQHRVLYEKGVNKRILRRGSIILDQDQDHLRAPTYEEASHHWRIPETTIKNWWSQRQRLLDGPVFDFRPQWPELETQLFERFLQERREQRAVRISWFRRTSRELYTQLYQTDQMFGFSRGWFTRFLNRKHLSLRRITKQATKLPEDYPRYSNNFLRYVRRVSQPNYVPPSRTEPSFTGQSLANLLPDGPLDAAHATPSLARPSLLTQALSRFELRDIHNVDETPIPFEYNEGLSFDPKGIPEVTVRTQSSGWSKRQATLIPVISADGEKHFKPMVIFRGKGNIPEEEKAHWHPDIEVCCSLLTFPAMRPTEPIHPGVLISNHLPGSLQ